MASAASFGLDASPPVLIAILAHQDLVPQIVGGGSIVFLAVLGAMGAKTGGANVLKGAIRVTFWSAVAMIVTATIGALFGTHV
jgi:vacuolar iron transporter family protein